MELKIWKKKNKFLDYQLISNLKVQQSLTIELLIRCEIFVF